MPSCLKYGISRSQVLASAIGSLSTPVPPPVIFLLAKDLRLGALVYLHTRLVIHAANVESFRALIKSWKTSAKLPIDHKLDHTPFPVTVIGVRVVDARAAKTGVPRAATCAAAHTSARTPDAIFCLIGKNDRRKKIN